MCAALADAVAAVTSAAPVPNTKQFLVNVTAESNACKRSLQHAQSNTAGQHAAGFALQDAVQDVKDAAASAGASGHGKLDKSLKKLLLSLDAASSSDRSAIAKLALFSHNHHTCTCAACCCSIASS